MNTEGAKSSEKTLIAAVRDPVQGVESPIARLILMQPLSAELWEASAQAQDCGSAAPGHSERLVSCGSATATEAAAREETPARRLWTALEIFGVILAPSFMPGERLPHTGDTATPQSSAGWGCFFDFKKKVWRCRKAGQTLKNLHRTTTIHMKKVLNQHLVARH